MNNIAFETIAEEVHQKAIAYSRATNQFAYKFFMEIKKIRDERFYKHLGYQTFEMYCEDVYGLGRDYVYENIQIADRFSEEFIGAHRQLGHQKLLFLSRIPEPQRNAFIKSNPIDEMTTRELQAAIKAQKDAENKVADLEAQLVKSKSQPPKVEYVEIEKTPDDYEELKRQLHDLKVEKYQLNYELSSKVSAEKELEETKRKFKENEAERKRLEDKIAEIGEARIRAANRTTFRTKVNDMLVAVAKGMQEATNCVSNVELEEIALQIKRINEVFNQAVTDANQWTFIEGGQHEHIEYIEV